jgi:hypothetical protein
MVQDIQEKPIKDIVNIGGKLNADPEMATEKRSFIFIKSNLSIALCFK